MLFPIWLLGVWTYFKIKNAPASEPVGWAMFFGSAASYVIYRHTGAPQLLMHWTVTHLGTNFVVHKLYMSKQFLDSYIVGPLVALHFLGVASVAPRLAKLLGRIKRPVRYMAEFTFATYLFHFPLLLFFDAASSDIVQPLFRIAIVVCGTVSVVWALGTVTERRKSDLKLWLLSTYDAIAQKASPAVTELGE